MADRNQRFVLQLSSFDDVVGKPGRIHIFNKGYIHVPLFVLLFKPVLKVGISPQYINESPHIPSIDPSINTMGCIHVRR